VDKNNPYLGEAGRLIYDLAAMRKRPLSFTNRGNLSARQWLNKAHKAFLNGMGCQFETVPLDVREDAVAQRNGYSEHRISFASTAIHRVAALVLVPEEATPPYPAVVALHDHGGFFLFGKEKIVECPLECEALLAFKKGAYDGLSWASELARRGYLVVAIDAFGWGERAFDRPTVRSPKSANDCYAEAADETQRRNEPLVKASPHADLYSAWAGISWAGIINWDDRRTVDYLLSRPDVDKRRIACLGLSGGGFRSTYLFGADRRLAAAGIVGWMTCLSEQLLHDSSCHLGMFSAPAAACMLDHPDIAALGAPKPVFVQQCGQDSLYPKWAMKQACERIAEVYASLGHPENFKKSFYDVPHCFNTRMQTNMFDWLDVVLKNRSAAKRGAR